MAYRSLDNTNRSREITFREKETTFPSKDVNYEEIRSQIKVKTSLNALNAAIHKLEAQLHQTISSNMVNPEQKAPAPVKEEIQVQDTRMLTEEDIMTAIINECVEIENNLTQYDSRPSNCEDLTD
jgi:hypothetical protein